MAVKPENRWPYVRTAVLFIAGLVGVAFEAALWGLAKRQPDPTLSLMFCAMMGLSIGTWPKNGGGK